MSDFGTEHREPKSPRKIIQLLMSAGQSWYAVCADGTIWWLVDNEWRQSGNSSAEVGGEVSLFSQGEVDELMEWLASLTLAELKILREYWERTHSQQ